MAQSDQTVLTIDTQRPLAHTLPMNITISIEDQVVAQAREKAAEMGRTLEQEIEDLIQRLANKPERVGLPPGRKTLREDLYNC
jgi:hypothetical protein